MEQDLIISVSSFLSVQSDVQYEQYVHTPHHFPSTNHPPPQHPSPQPGLLDSTTSEASVPRCSVVVSSPPSPTVKQEAEGVADCLSFASVQHQPTINEAVDPTINEAGPGVPPLVSHLRNVPKPLCGSIHS